MGDKNNDKLQTILTLLSAIAEDMETVKSMVKNGTVPTTDGKAAHNELIKGIASLEQKIDRLPNAFIQSLKPFLTQRDKVFNECANSISDTFDEYAEASNNLQRSHIEELKNVAKALAIVKHDIIAAIPNENKTKPENDKPEKLKMPSGFKHWVKFLFYDCPKYSFSIPVRTKFLCQFGATCRLLLTIIAVVLLFLLANENHHLKRENNILQKIELLYLT